MNIFLGFEEIILDEKIITYIGGKVWIYKDLTIGSSYIIDKESEYYYRIINNKGKRHWYEKKYFLNN